MKEYEIENQWGQICRAFFSYSDQEKSSLIQNVSQLIVDIKQSLNIDCIISYGLLLGSIRNQKLIDHDFDVDICFIVPDYSIENVYKYCNKLLQFFCDKKCSIYFFSNGQFGIWFNVSPEICVKIEFFASWFQNGQYYQNFAIDGKADIKDVYPLAKCAIENVELPCPNNYEKILSIIYGNNWKIPDKNFKYDFRNIINTKPFLFLETNKNNINYWDSYYSTKENNLVWSKEPSSFVKFVDPNLSKHQTILDVGCGNCRDSDFFQINGHTVTLIDGSKESLNYCNKNFEEKYHLNIENTYEVINFIKNHKKTYDIIYSRFFLHSISEIGQLNFFLISNKLIKNDGSIYIELRVKNHTNDNMEYFENTDDHYRRIQQIDNLLCHINLFNFSISSVDIGTNMAQYLKENPHISRLILKKNKEIKDLWLDKPIE